ncbi:hypothetical protein CDL15_Pgr001556 [Punica granatum]|uniref:Germin-like protein n=1 Tax=Punica granatum TaxID=22663 RepID=A0A218X4P0_PUNGR|nr:hypothetical protein CDL15_Pgr001556 [Punica granatum]
MCPGPTLSSRQPDEARAASLSQPQRYDSSERRITEDTKGDAKVFPQGLVHFQVNPGFVDATGLNFYSSSNPRLQILHLALFGNDLPHRLAEQSTFLDAATVKKLKAMLGGSY